GAGGRHLAAHPGPGRRGHRGPAARPPVRRDRARTPRRRPAVRGLPRPGAGTHAPLRAEGRRPAPPLVPRVTYGRAYRVADWGGAAHGRPPTKGAPMARCETCGNDYYLSFDVV